MGIKSQQREEAMSGSWEVGGWHPQCNLGAPTDAPRCKRRREQQCSKLTPLPPQSKLSCVSQPGLVQLRPAPSASMAFPRATSCKQAAAPLIQAWSANYAYEALNGSLQLFEKAIAVPFHCKGSQRAFSFCGGQRGVFPYS